MGAEAVIDQFKLINIEKNHGKGIRRIIEVALDGLIYPVEEKKTVGNPGERVMEGIVGELVFQLFLVGDIIAIDVDCPLFLEVMIIPGKDPVVDPVFNPAKWFIGGNADGD